MDYSLALQLQEAGFPQTSPREVFCVECKEVAEYKKCYKHNKEYIVVPTLEELIEECGKSLGDLTQTFNGWATNLENVGGYPETEGKTPLEAVAHLYIALNKK